MDTGKPVKKRLTALKMPRARIFLGVLVFLSLFAAISTFISTSVGAVQTTPYTINYQGRLTDSSGTAMADGQYNMTFRLYSVSTGGAAVWSEVRDTTTRVTVLKGQFNVQLGSVAALTPTIFASQPLYFEVELPSVATATCSIAACASYTEGPMTPRQALASSAYAMNADLLDGVDGSSFARRDVTNTYTSTQLVQTSATNAFAVQQTGGASALVVNTTNQRVAVGDITTPVATLSVQTAAAETLPALVVNNVGSGNIAQFQASGTNIATISNSGVAITATSTTAFSIQKAAGADVLFTADSTNNKLVVGNATGTDTATTLLVLDSSTADPTTAATNGAMYYNSSLGKFRCYQAGAWTNCISPSGPATQQVTLIPEYAGGVLSANGAVATNVNASSSAVSGLTLAQGYKHNFYQWNTTSATAQQYSIIVNYQLPSNFTSFVASSFNIWTYADVLTSTGATFTLKSANGTSCYVAPVSVIPTAAATWQNKGPGDPANGCTFAANDVITIIITPSLVVGSGNVNIGELGFAYQ